MSKGLTSRIALATLILGIPFAASADEDFRDVQFLFGIIHQRLETQRVGAAEAWLNPETGNSGVVIIDGEDTAGGMRCRDYRRITDSVGTEPIIHSGRGCRDNTGRWRLQPEVAAAPPTVPGRSPEPAPTTPPVTRADPESTEPPPQFPPPAHKPDPDVFYANIPTPSVY